jgi:hypothetical protein
MDAREVDSNAVPFSGPLPRSNLNQKLALRLALRMGALHLPDGTGHSSRCTALYCIPRKELGVTF